MAMIKGTNNSETKYGTAFVDTIYGYGGNDSLYGRAGSDTIWGGVGNDKIWGDAGNDTLRGEDGTDFVYGGDGNDLIYGGSGNDTLYGDAGTDTIYGGAGNDVIKGGTGISHLYGGSGNDSLYYDPTTENISKLGSYLSTTTLDGGANYDTLYVYSRATYTETGTGLVKPAQVEIDIGYDTNTLYFEGPRRQDPFIKAGTFTNIEKIVAGGNTAIDFWGSHEDRGMTVIGSSARDTFNSSYANDIMDGGAGDDRFNMWEGTGVDIIYSTETDNDTFYFTAYDGAAAKINGFNGEGVARGDKLIFSVYKDMWPEPPESLLTVSESGNRTFFDFDNGAIYAEVDAVGLKPGLDYAFEVL
ncbi:hypothetical protein JL100_032295 (plasmid) [Skermanella mucosa]|uniref:calcium-binding protein n=1 Tax=Skermanella mucosa TaxID=1789672 RepID=UPI00192C0C48|nr:calcium-binding protein [Skermanella mucosa]UEM24314.1 hypothetical protein JL100_032295 [Skermanella mucosa]